MKPRVLFILKRHEGSGGPLHSSSGLRNSATFVCDMLNDRGIATARTVTVTDANDIDREVAQFKPDTAVLEAIWCPPAKLAEVQKLHPKVEWTVRIHSEVPFLAIEGMALTWLHKYTKIPKVEVSANSFRAARDLYYLTPVFLPNYYPLSEREAPDLSIHPLRIGCFGAIRPMKNQLAQAFAAVNFAKQVHARRLEFHVNASRTEQGGENILKNLRAFFDAQVGGYDLVEDEWGTHEEFLELVRSMNVCMTVSFSETFSIVAADAAGQMVPLVTSAEVPWSDRAIQALPNEIPDMVAKLTTALGVRKRHILKSNFIGIRKYNEGSVLRWTHFVEPR